MICLLFLQRPASTLIHSGDKLYGSHIEGWADLWKAGRIDVSGNLTIAKAVFSSMYHLLSSVPLEKDDFWPFVGLSPSGLPLGDFDHPQVMSFNLVHLTGITSQSLSGHQTLCSHRFILKMFDD